MTQPSHVTGSHPKESWGSHMAMPISTAWCLTGWVGSTALFLGIVRLFGGPAHGDSPLTTGPTSAIAHGQLACALPRSGATVAPLYPMISGAIAATIRIGHSEAFPSGRALGPSCARAQNAFEAWLLRAHGLQGTLLIGYVGWIALLVGIVTLLRASGRGRCGWEPATLFIVACLPPVWLTIEEYFHPQDLLAMGLALASVACVRRDAWVGAGILIALAVLSQQFAVLVAVPLLVVAPIHRRASFAVAGLATAALVALPLLIASSGHNAHAVLLGTGNTAYNDGTLVSTLHLEGGALFLVARLIPIACSFVLAAWLVHRLGRPASREPVVLVSLVALCLSLRLIFEPSLYGYYFMALAVALVVVDVIRGRIRSVLIAWLMLFSLAYAVEPDTYIFWRLSWGREVHNVLPPAVLVIALVVVAVDLMLRGLRWNLLAWVALAACAAWAWSSSVESFTHPLTLICIQIVLVFSGIALAALPLSTWERAPRDAFDEGQFDAPDLMARAD
jgi:Glycosyltransferase family 87